MKPLSFPLHHTILPLFSSWCSEKRSQCSNHLLYKSKCLYLHSLFAACKEFSVYFTLLSSPNLFHLSLLLHLTRSPLREGNNIEFPFTTSDLSFPWVSSSNFFPTPFFQNANKLHISLFKSSLFHSSTFFSSILNPLQLCFHLCNTKPASSRSTIILQMSSPRANLIKF